MRYSIVTPNGEVLGECEQGELKIVKLRHALILVDDIVALNLRLVPIEEKKKAYAYAVRDERGYKIVFYDSNAVMEHGSRRPELDIP